MASARAVRSKSAYRRNIGWAVLLFAFVLALSVQLGRWSSMPSVEAEKQAARARATSPGAYTGSLLLPPDTGDQCVQRALDNRTDRITDMGLVPCNAVLGQGGGGGSSRLDAIRKGFRGN